MDDWTNEMFEDEFWNIVDGTLAIGEEPLMEMRAFRCAEKAFSKYVIGSVQS